MTRLAAGATLVLAVCGALAVAAAAAAAHARPPKRDGMPLGVVIPDLVDHVLVDGALAWEQVYERVLPAEAHSRSVPYSDVLPTLLASPQAGPAPHRNRRQAAARGKTDHPLSRRIPLRAVTPSLWQ